MKDYETLINRYLNTEYVNKVFFETYFYNEETFPASGEPFSADGCGNLYNALSNLEKISSGNRVSGHKVTIVTGGYNCLGSRRPDNYFRLLENTQSINFLILNDRPDVDFMNQFGNIYKLTDPEELLEVTKNIIETEYKI